MKFDFDGYSLHFIQKQACTDGSAHLFTLIYKFFSPVTKYFYILHADYHSGNVFAIKFYCKKDRHSHYKYTNIVNKGDIGNILITCLKAVPLLLTNYPDSSFVFAGASTIDRRAKRMEPAENNQRFRIYRYVIAEKIGNQTFAHFVYEPLSAYLLVNKVCGDVISKEAELRKIFSETYIFTVLN